MEQIVDYHGNEISLLDKILVARGTGYGSGYLIKGTVTGIGWRVDDNSKYRHRDNPEKWKYNKFLKVMVTDNMWHEELRIPSEKSIIRLSGDTTGNKYVELFNKVIRVEQGRNRGSFGGVIEVNYSKSQVENGEVKLTQEPYVKLIDMKTKKNMRCTIGKTKFTVADDNMLAMLKTLYGNREK